MGYDINSLAKFFELDLKIKKLLMEMAPTLYDNTNSQARMKYMDRVADYTRTLRRYFQIMADTLPLLDKKFVKNFFNYIEMKLYKFDYRYGDINTLYKYLYADINPELVDEVNKKYIGYYVLKDFGNPLVSKCTTINELLHVTHAAIMNDENLYFMIPPIKVQGDVRLRGFDSPLAEQLFEALPGNTRAGFIDILGLSKEHFIVMFRDLGHATTIEITEENNQVYVSYFIPKLCNIEMIKKLKGINKIKIDDDKISGWATGSFRASKEEFLTETLHFIQMIPTDDDIEALKKYYR